MGFSHKAKGCILHHIGKGFHICAAVTHPVVFHMQDVVRFSGQKFKGKRKLGRIQLRFHVERAVFPRRFLFQDFALVDKHDFPVQTAALHQLRIGIELPGIGFPKLPMHGSDILPGGHITGSKGNYRQGLHKHSHRPHEGRRQGTSTLHRQIKGFVLPCQPPQNLPKSRLEEAPRRHAKVLAEPIDFLGGNRHGKESRRLSIWLSGFGKNGRNHPFCQFMEIALRFRVRFAALQLLLIEGKVVGSHTLPGKAFSG